MSVLSSEREEMTAEPELRQLRTFVAVAEELHFTRAATRLNLAQQALSSQIRKLEDRLGVELFERTTRRVELTEAGRTLLGHALPLLASATRAWEDVARVGAGEIGQLSVSYAPTARREVLPAIMAEIHRRHPRLEIKWCELWGGREAIASGIAEVAIVRGPIPDDPEICGATLLESPLGIVLGSDHPLAGSTTLAVEQLAGSAVTIPARRFAPGFHDAIVAALRSRGFDDDVLEYENLGSRYLLDDEAAMAHICSGKVFGIGFENQYPSLPPELVWIPVAPPLSVPMNMCWREQCGPSVRNFVAAALDVAHERGWQRPDHEALLLETAPAPA
jgi:DNA-binding transcriptional LysR family regulator